MPFEITVPLLTKQIEAKTLINAITQEAILNKYSQPKQASLQAQFSVLIHFGLDSIDNPQVIYIKSVWNEINHMRALSDNAIYDVNSATTLEQIQVIVDGFFIP